MNTGPYWFIFLLNLSILAFANKTSIAQDRFIVHHYTNENGLPANGVKGIEVDKENGFVWIGTQAGLVRYDGKQFQDYAKMKAMPSARIIAINRNKEGSIFAEDDNFQIYRIDNNKPTLVEVDSFSLKYSMLRIGENDQIVPARQIANLVQTYPQTDFLPYKIVFHDGRTTTSSFSFVYNLQVYHKSSPDDPLTIVNGGQDIFKVGNTIYFINDKLEITKFNGSLEGSQKVQVAGLAGIIAGSSGMPQLIWTAGMEAPVLISGKEIWQIKHRGDSLYCEIVCKSCVPENALISSAQVWKEQGLILLGSEVNGLYVINTPFLKAIRTDTGKASGAVEYAQLEVVPGIVNTASGLAFSTDGNLLGNKPIVRFPHSNVYQDKQGDYWYSTRDTVFHFSANERKVTKVLLRDGSTRIIFAESEGRFYSISDQSISEINNNQFRQVYRLPVLSGPMKNTLDPTAVLEWKPGVLAIAAQELVLFDIKKDQQIDSIPIPGLYVKVRSLWKHRDYLFIGTYGQGFYVYKNGLLKKMPIDKMGYLSYVHCFAEDNNGFCWISTNRGLFKASINALLKAYEEDLNEIYYHYFGKDDGMYNSEMNGGCQPCGLHLSNGHFSFPTMDGVVMFNPLEKHSPPPAGRIFVDEITVDTVTYYDTDNSFDFPYETKSFRFRLSMPQFGNKENIYFSYKLEPYLDKWETQDLIQNNTIVFGHLKPGKYKLYLRVRNGFEPDQFGMSVIEFNVAQPWYQTWWSFSLWAAALISLIWGIVKWRTANIARRRKELQELVDIQTRNIESQSRQLESQLQQLQTQQEKLEKDNNVKARLIGIISHDMISPLKFIGYMSMKLQEVFPPADPNHHTAAFIANVANELEALSVNILNWIKFHQDAVKMKPEKFDLKTFFGTTLEIPATLAKEKGIQFIIDIPENVEVNHYKQAIGVILYNLAMNAVKYTAAGEIYVSVRFDETGGMMKVRDTGAGMPDDLVSKLNSGETYVAGYSVGETSRYQFGYVIVKDLLRLVGGTMQIVSRINTGTEITLSFTNLSKENASGPL